jgi:hypothetical protein
MPPSSESIPKTITQPLHQKLSVDVSGNDSDASVTSSTEYLIPPPKHTVLFEEFNKIMSRPGPMSIKRKLIQQLENNTTTNLVDTSEEIVLRQIYEMKAPASPKRKKPKTRPAASSLTSTGSNSLPDSFGDRQSLNLEPILAEIISSPVSSNLVLHSPIISNSPSMRMQTQSQKDDLLVKSGIYSQRPAPRSIDSSSSSASSRGNPNPHSNGAAPRRIQNQPSPTSLGASGRNPRINIKNTGG